MKQLKNCEMPFRKMTEPGREIVFGLMISLSITLHQLACNRDQNDNRYFSDDLK